jgi:hypothetical protein
MTEAKPGVARLIRSLNRMVKQALAMTEVKPGGARLS